MATLLKTDGTAQPITEPLTLETMQRLVGGYVEFVRLDGAGGLLVVDEDGLAKDKPINIAATALYRVTHGVPRGVIVGDAVCCVVTNMGLDTEAYA